MFLSQFSQFHFLFVSLQSLLSNAMEQLLFSVFIFQITSSFSLAVCPNCNSISFTLICCCWFSFKIRDNCTFLWSSLFCRNSWWYSTSIFNLAWADLALWSSNLCCSISCNSCYFLSWANMYGKPTSSSASCKAVYSEKWNWQSILQATSHYF